MSVAVASQDREMCVTADCWHLAWRNGLCGTHYRKRLLRPAVVDDDAPRRHLRHAAPRSLTEEPADLAWSVDDPERERERRRRLALADAVLLAIENFNWYADPGEGVPDALILAYRQAGGDRVWHDLVSGDPRRPTGPELHEDTLELEESFLRHPAI